MKYKQCQHCSDSPVIEYLLKKYSAQPSFIGEITAENEKEREGGVERKNVAERE